LRAIDALQCSASAQDLAMSTASGDTTTLVLPPLESGDRLTRAEFERRYEHMPRRVRAELIEGVVYTSTTVRARTHGAPHAFMMAWLGSYAVALPETQLIDGGSLRLDVDTEVQPDAVLRIDEAHWGSSRISPDDILEGAPELVGEIATSSASSDLHDKLRVYRRNGVQEYIVWTMYPNCIQWFRLEKGAYVPLTACEDGILRSQVFPGLWLDVAALLAEKPAQVLAVLQEGLRAPEHTAFVERLRAQSSSGE
jgi:Uma2 family endonuclease